MSRDGLFRGVIGLALVAASCGDDPAPRAGEDAGSALFDLGSVDRGLPDFGPHPPPASGPSPGIFEVQQGLVPAGSWVRLEGIVSATGTTGFFLIEPVARPFGGVFVEGSEQLAWVGHEVEIRGVVEELEIAPALGSRTQIRLEGLTVTGTGTIPPPLPVRLPELLLPELAEPYEGVVVELEDVTITELDTARMRIDVLLEGDPRGLDLDPAWRSAGMRFDRLAGVLQLDARGFFLIPRSPADGEPRPPSADGCLPLGDHLLCLDRLGWDDARVSCAYRGGRLAILETREENELVSTRVREHTSRVFWIAANDREMEGTFRWTDGSTLTYSAWAENEPNDAGGAEDCAQGNFRGVGQWNDGRCSGGQVYVCEFDRPAPRCRENVDCGADRRCEDGRCRAPPAP